MRGMKMGTAQHSAPPKIVAYGHNKSHFVNAKEIINFIEDGVVSGNERRYRYTRHEDADIIVLSLGGFAFGHFDIQNKVAPDSQDRHELRSVKCVYIVARRARYLQPVRLMPLGVRVQPWGASVSLEQFQQIKKQAGHIEIFP
jgi:hypothetical protein